MIVIGLRLLLEGGSMISPNFQVMCTYICKKKKKKEEQYASEK